jgi:hypothetical protein
MNLCYFRHQAISDFPCHQVTFAIEISQQMLLLVRKEQLDFLTTYYQSLVCRYRNAFKEFLSVCQHCGQQIGNYLFSLSTVYKSGALELLVGTIHHTPQEILEQL